MTRGSAFSTIGFRLGRSLEQFAKATNKDEQRETIQKAVREFYENLNMDLERDMLRTMLRLYATKSVGYPIVAQILEVGKNSNNDFTIFVNGLFDNSLFGSESKIMQFIQDPSLERLEKDPMMVFSKNLVQHLQGSASADIQAKQEKYNHAFRLMVEGMRKASPREKFYPDANSTMRITYGKVRALPADARNSAPENYFTILEDMVKKHKPGDAEFNLSQGMIDIHSKKDYGPYADKNGFMFVNFLTDQDITGGNSGSPVINGKGELIGLAFDGNIEAMAGDVIFDPNLQRTINVDIRFVLLVMDKYAGARNLINELTLAK